MNNIMSSSLGSVIGCVRQAWSWFFQLLNGMGGSSWFITTFLGLFVLSRFTDLVLMEFLYSPTSIDATYTEFKAIEKNPKVKAFTKKWFKR